MAQRVGISDGRTFKKYLNKCLEAGLCIKHVHRFNTAGKRIRYHFISYFEALEKLLGFNGKELEKFILHRNLGKLHNYKQQIELDIFSLNISQQAYKVSSNFPDKNYIINELKNLANLSVPEKTTRANRVRKGKLIKKLSTADRRIEESILKKHRDAVVTGCKHTARLIGVSATTGHKRIKKWIEQGTLKVHDVVFFTPAHLPTGSPCNYRCI